MPDYDADDLDYETYLKHLPDVPALSSSTMVLDDMLELLDDITVQKLMRDMPPEDVAMALAGASGKVRLRFIDNMGSRGGMILVDDIASMQETATEKDMLAKQRQMAVLLQGRTPD